MRQSIIDYLRPRNQIHKKQTKMKKIVFFCMMCMLMAASTFTAHAQEESKDYFVGKWLVKIQDLPVDIEEMMVDVARVDGKLKVNLSADGQQIEVQQVNEKETSITFYFNGNGFDVDMTLVKKSQNEVTGDMLSQFDLTGKRVTKSPQTR